jgi:hypothetical protein
LPAVEGSLSADPSLGEVFKDFGLPTAWILQNLDFARLGDDLFQHLRPVAGRRAPRDLLEPTTGIDTGLVVLPAQVFHRAARLDCA